MFNVPLTILAILCTALGVCLAYRLVSRGASRETIRPHLDWWFMLQRWGFYFGWEYNPDKITVKQHEELWRGLWEHGWLSPIGFEGKGHRFFSETCEQLSRFLLYSSRFSIQVLNLVTKMYEPAPELITPANAKGNPNSLRARLHPITRKPIIVSIAPKIQVSKGAIPIHCLVILF